jgi:hypothetical protein
MKKILDMEFGFPDAENYRRREFKNKFNRIFSKDRYLDDLLKPEISFLMGEKGTGKTAYAVYMSNNSYKETYSDLKFIRETEYQKFVALKKEEHLDLSDYTNIWRVIILLMLSKQITDRESGLLPKFFKFRDLNAAINEYYLHAFSPEIIHALQFVQQSKIAAELLCKYAKASGEQQENITFSESRFQTNLLYIQKSFEKAIAELKLSNNHTLFIDGIDIRPNGIDYPEYLDCVKGLANAVWQLNNDFFPSIRDSKGRLKVVLLIRPDIFASIGLQNQNTKIRSNSVLLDWRTLYKNYLSSRLFHMADKILYSQQSQEDKLNLKQGNSWKYYFPYQMEDASDYNNSSFIGFLRYSFYRPRDIIVMLDIMRANAEEKDENNKISYTWKDFDRPEFKKKLSDYLLGEIKDQISFYYTIKDYEMFLKFFEFLNGSTRFQYKNYLNIYKKLTVFANSTDYKLPQFMDSANKFLQFLYELNIICYIEDVEGHKPFIHWCFRDRNYSNISPKIKEGVRYEIFYGLARAVGAGKRKVFRS